MVGYIDDIVSAIALSAVQLVGACNAKC